MNIQTIAKNTLQAGILSCFYGMVAGAFYRVTWQRILKVRKTHSQSIVVKTVVATVKAGITYDNLANVQDKRANGELPSVNAGLPWGQWLDFPRVIEHKGNHYLRLYPANEFGRMMVGYTLNGSPCSIETAKEHCLASEFSDNESLDCFTVKLDNLKDFARLVKP